MPQKTLHKFLKRQYKDCRTGARHPFLSFSHLSDTYELLLHYYNADEMNLVWKSNDATILHKFVRERMVLHGEWKHRASIKWISHSIRRCQLGPNVAQPTKRHWIKVAKALQSDELVPDTTLGSHIEIKSYLSI